MEKIIKLLDGSVCTLKILYNEEVIIAGEALVEEFGEEEVVDTWNDIIKGVDVCYVRVVTLEKSRVKYIDSHLINNITPKEILESYLGYNKHCVTPKSIKEIHAILDVI